MVEGGAINEVKGGVGVESQEEGAGVQGVIKEEFVGPEDLFMGRLSETTSKESSTSSRHVQRDATYRDDGSRGSGGESLGVLSFIHREKVCSVFKVCFWFPGVVS